MVKWPENRLIFSFATGDFNNDKKTDVIAGGNFYGVTPNEGRYDAMPVTIGIGVGNGTFAPLMPIPVAFEKLQGEIRSILPIKLANKKKGLLMAVNNEQLKLFEYR